MPKGDNQGWLKLFNTKKWHFFGKDGRSLCGNWMIFSVPPDAEDTNHDHPENCKKCQRKRKAME